MAPRGVALLSHVGSHGAEDRGEHDPQQGITNAGDGTHEADLEVLDGVEGRGLALLLDRQAGAQQKSGHGRGGVEVPASVGKGLAVALIVVAVDLLQGVGLGKDDGRGELGLVVEAVDGHAPTAATLIEILLGQNLALGGLDGVVTHLREPPRR